MDLLNLSALLHVVFGVLIIVMSGVSLFLIPLIETFFVWYMEILGLDEHRVEVEELVRLIILLHIVSCILGVVSGLFKIWVAYYLRKGMRHTLCAIYAGFECIFFPLGTALGIFTLVVLFKPQVKAYFQS